MIDFFSCMGIEFITEDEERLKRFLGRVADSKDIMAKEK